MPNVRSTFYMFCADADVETTYPTAGIILNQGKEQTEAELCYIPAIGAENQRRQSINVTGGRVNAIEILQVVCKGPKLDDWADFINEVFEEETREINGVIVKTTNESGFLDLGVEVLESDKFEEPEIFYPEEKEEEEA